MKTFLLLKVFLLFIFFNGCGKQEAKPGDFIEPAFFAEPEGIYAANFYPVNEKFAEHLNGKVTVSKYGDDFNVIINFKNGPGGLHIQGIYSGEACPKHDFNDDGVIDILEAEQTIGHLLVPLDGDLSGQTQGNDFYPTNKNYDYKRSTSFSLMTSELAPEDQDLKFKGKVVVISGVPKTQLIPTSASTTGDRPPHETIPIACGILGQTYDDLPEHDPYPEPPQAKPPPEPEPLPPPPPGPEEEYYTLRERIGYRLRGWWCRIRGCVIENN